MNANPLARLGDAEGGGQSGLVDGLSRALASLGHSVTIFTRRDDPNVPAALPIAPNVTLAALDAGPAQSIRAAESLPWIAAFGDSLARAWRLDPPDVVHAFCWISGKAAIAAALGQRLPVVATFHPFGARDRRRGDPARGLGRVADDEEIAIVRSAARIVATSSSEVFALLSNGAGPRTIKFVPCGVDLERFTPAGEREPLRSGRFRLVTLGRLVPREGVQDAIEALSLVAGVELVVGGGAWVHGETARDPDLLRLQALAQRLGVADRVEFRGNIERRDVATFLRSADAVISTPHDESMGTVALEAMACGIPLVVSTVGGLIDVVADGMTGIHVPPCSPRQIAYAIEELHKNPTCRERFGRFGAERTRARYGWSRIALETFEVYASVTGCDVRRPQRSGIAR